MLSKHLYRAVEHLLDRIDSSVGDEQLLVDILHLLVESDDTATIGVVSGRLYKERDRDYQLIKSISGHGPGIAGKTVSKDYQVVKDIEQHRVWIVSPDSPGFDPELEAQFSDVDSAAILVGQDPSYILSLGLRHHGSEDDLLLLLGTIRSSIGLKLREESLASQMRQARIIQHSLLPAHPAGLKGFDLAAISCPAEDVGGDVYDVQPLGDGTLGLLLADASGHGLPAALQARDVVIGMRMGQAKGEKITATISRLNKVIHGSGLASRFISLFYGELEDTGNLVYVNGGHCPPLLITPEGNAFELKTCGPVLGPLPDASYRRGYLALRPGEALVVFSDGVTERARLQADGGDLKGDEAPVEFGRERLIRAVKGLLEQPAQSIVEGIISLVTEFGGGKPFSDDVSLLVVKRLPADNYPPAEDLTRLSEADTRR